MPAGCSLPPENQSRARNVRASVSSPVLGPASAFQLQASSHQVQGKGGCGGCKACQASAHQAHEHLRTPVRVQSSWIRAKMRVKTETLGCGAVLGRWRQGSCRCLRTRFRVDRWLGRMQGTQAHGRLRMPWDSPSVWVDA